MLTILSLAGVVSGSAAIGQRVRRRGGVGLGDDSGRGFGAGAGVALQERTQAWRERANRGGLMGPVLGGADESGVPELVEARPVRATGPRPGGRAGEPANEGVYQTRDASAP